MFSGSFTVFMQNEQMINAVMMIPVLLWTLERLFSQPNSRNIVLSAFIFALLLLAGTQAVILYILLLAAAYFAFRVITSKAAKKIKIKYFLLIIFCFILGLGLASPFIFSFIDFFGNTANLRSFEGKVASIQNWSLLWLIISPGMGEIPAFYRTHPANGLWDYLGGYSGILPAFLIIGYLITTILFLKRKIRLSALFSFFLFFLGFGLFIILKDFGPPPFKWINYLPFFNMSWTPRWSGPIWIFCFAIAGALGFELLKEEKNRIFEIIQQSKNLKNFVISVLFLIICASLVLPLIFYYQSDRLLDFDPIAKMAFLTRWELFVGSWLASLLILGLAVYLIYSFIKNQNKNALYGLFALILLELWFWVPRGYGLNSMRLKLGLFIFGLMIVIAVWKGKRLFVLIGAFLFFLSFLFLDTVAHQGLPQRYDPFTEPPYIKYLKNENDGYW